MLLLQEVPCNQTREKTHLQVPFLLLLHWPPTPNMLECYSKIMGVILYFTELFLDSFPDGNEVLSPRPGLYRTSGSIVLSWYDFVGTWARSAQHDFASDYQRLFTSP
jgi:hypothetical protein